MRRVTGWEGMLTYESKLNADLQYAFVHRATSRDAELTCVDDAAELLAAQLPLVCDGQQVRVVTEERPPQLCGTLQQTWVSRSRQSVFFRSEAIDAAAADAGGDVAMNVVVHVKPEAQGRDPVTARFAACSFWGDSMKDQYSRDVLERLKRDLQVEIVTELGLQFLVHWMPV